MYPTPIAVIATRPQRAARRRAAIASLLALALTLAVGAGPVAPPARAADGRVYLPALFQRSGLPDGPVALPSATRPPAPSATDLPAPSATEPPTAEPTGAPTGQATDVPTLEPTDVPTDVPTLQPTLEPTAQATVEPTVEPTKPAPDADGCPDEAFLDVSQYPGAGPQYPDPELAVRCSADELIVTGNGIPHYAFVPITPNPLRAVAHEYHLPLRPALAAAPSALPLLGTAGVAVNGLPFFGPNEAGQPAAQAFGDPIYNGIMDACLGHTAAEYHYHGLLVDCFGGGDAGEPSPIIAFAADGFPIYGPFGCLDAGCAQVVEMQSSWDRVGDPRTNAWDAYAFHEKPGAQYLDRCNGRVGPDGTYRYHATATFPYIIGCYAGTPRALGGGGGRPPRPQPLVEALRALLAWPTR